MKDQARVVVVGGGVFGASVAYHLATAGCTDVVLVDKGELTSGTTFHSVGLVSQFRTSPALMKIVNYTINLFNELAQGDGGASLGWRTVGSMRLASSPDRFKALKREVSRVKAIGLAADIISAKEVVDRCPFVSGEGLYGAVWVPDDGYIDPNGITYELARQARKMGVEIHTNVRVTGIELSPRRQVTRVITDHGPIRTECVVNAAGEWAPRLAEMVGVSLPMIPLMHQYLTTKPIPGHELPPNTPVIRDPDNLFYCREDTGAFLIGGFELNPKEWSPEGVPWEFNQQLLSAEWDLFGPVMENAIRRLPIMAEAEAAELINGPDAFTPDGHSRSARCRGCTASSWPPAGRSTGSPVLAAWAKPLPSGSWRERPPSTFTNWTSGASGPIWPTSRIWWRHAGRSTVTITTSAIPRGRKRVGPAVGTSHFYERLQDLGAFWDTRTAGSGLIIWILENHGGRRAGSTRADGPAVLFQPSGGRHPGGAPRGPFSR